MNQSFTEHSTVQKRILEYSSQIGWKVLTPKETEELRCFDSTATLPAERAKNSYPFLKDILLQKVF